MIDAGMRVAVIIVILFSGTSLFGQGGLDVLGQARSAPDAALGLTQDVLRQPHLLNAEGGQSETILSAWSWIADIGGLDLVARNNNTALAIDVLRVGDLEYRGETPSSEPISNFQYSLVELSAAYGKEFGKLSSGVGVSLIRERSLNSSALGAALHFSVEYPLLQGFNSSAGIRHLGRMQNLNNESSKLPTEVWASLSRSFNQSRVVIELNTGPTPIQIGASYDLIRTLRLMGGVQVENSDDGAQLHPSVGFLLTAQQFKLGFALSDLLHDVGMRQHYTLYWDF